MNDFSIPVVVNGPGSQPAEPDGTDIDILQMPSGMSTYEAPPLPEPEEVQELSAAKSILHELLTAMRSFSADVSSVQFDLDVLDAANRELVDQVLGEGEVSVVFSGDQEVRIQESVLAGVWRLKVSQNGRLVQDIVEIAAIPRLVRDSAFNESADSIVNADAIPEGVLNAPPLVSEINDKVAMYRPGDEAHVINLTLLPQTEQDLAYLGERLGEGLVAILSRGYGNCRITSTGTANVWWVQYFNSQNKNILNSLEITDVPSVACAAQEDIADSADRLQEILEIYR